MEALGQKQTTLIFDNELLKLSSSFPESIFKTLINRFLGCKNQMSNAGDTLFKNETIICETRESPRKVERLETSCPSFTFTRHCNYTLCEGQMSKLSNRSYVLSEHVTKVVLAQGKAD